MKSATTKAAIATYSAPSCPVEHRRSDDDGAPSAASLQVDSMTFMVLQIVLKNAIVFVRRLRQGGGRLVLLTAATRATVPTAGVPRVHARLAGFDKQLARATMYERMTRGHCVWLHIGSRPARSQQLSAEAVLLCTTHHYMCYEFFLRPSRVVAQSDDFVYDETNTPYTT